MSAGFTPLQEDDRLPNRRVSAVVITTTMVGIAAVAFSAWFLAAAGRGRDHGPASPTPAPSVIGTVEQILLDDAHRAADLRREQLDHLHRFGWIDRDHGIAHIPIERAMDLLADGGSR
jgi:hypothetical protein